VKLVSFAALPFHSWCLEQAVAAARRAGHEVVEVTHRPGHHHDWWTGSTETKEALQRAAVGADYLLAADYPFAPLRPLLPSLTEIVSLRHSLASRGNTYEPEQFEADHLPAFSEYDEAKIEATWSKHRTQSARNVTGPITKPVGCSWAAPVLSTDRAGARQRLLDRVGLRHDDPRPIVAVATTWNPWTSLGAVRDLAANKSRIVIWRPHWAAAWRRPGEIDEVRSFGAYVDDPLEHPATLLLGSDVLVGDVSGIILLATLVRSAPTHPSGGWTKGGLPVGGLPVVMVDPDPSALLDSGQLDVTGPEWEFRDMIGPRVSSRRAPGELAGAVDRILTDDPARESDPHRGSRSFVGAKMAGTYTRTDSADRLIAALTR
jgi:hypothetical protein